MLVTVLSQSSQGRYTKVGTIKSREVQYPHCNNDSACPTWFICNSQNICECGNEHSYEVVCDIERGEAAVLDCHCVTYDLIDRLDPPILDCASTTMITLKKWIIFVKNCHKNQKRCSINQSALAFTELVYCVAIVKKDTVHLYSHTISVA